jgi:hypothetical protein
MTSAMSTARPPVAVNAAAWGITALTAALVGLIIWQDLEGGRGATSATGFLVELAFVIALLAFVVSGAVIVSRQPHNVIGWLLIVPGLSAALGEVVTNWLLALDPGVTAGPGIWLGLWFVSWFWLLLIFPIFHLLLVFPDGVLLSARWRWVVGLEVAMMVFFIVAVTFSELLALLNDQDVTVWSISNPIGFIPESVSEVSLGWVFQIGLPLLTVAAVVAFVLRFRSASALQRQQLKWPLYAVAFFGIGYGATAVMGGATTGSALDALFGLSLAAIPISVAIAVLRYRLYDLDRLVSRTVTYAVVAALLVAVYGLIVLGLGSFLGRDNPLAVAGATLGAAALFNPLRTWIRGWVDRRFNRSRYDAEQVIEGFVSSMRARVDPDGLVEGWVGVVSETMQPASVGAWVRN